MFHHQPYNSVVCMEAKLSISKFSSGSFSSSASYQPMTCRPFLFSLSLSLSLLDTFLPSLVPVPFSLFPILYPLFAIPAPYSGFFLLLYFVPVRSRICRVRGLRIQRMPDCCVYEKQFVPAIASFHQRCLPAAPHRSCISTFPSSPHNYISISTLFTHPTPLPFSLPLRLSHLSISILARSPRHGFGSAGADRRQA